MQAFSIAGAVSRVLWLLLGLASLAGPLAGPLAAQSSRKAVILSINDVYRIEGVENSTLGGMARVRALRAELQRITPDMLFLHAGDFLGPSFLSRTYSGGQMIDLMNVMDGNPRPGAFDPRMFVVFGNHEFDGTNCGKDGPLAGLVAASEFTWLASNIDFNRCEKLRALAGKSNIAVNRIIESGGLKIGLFSLTLAYPEYAAVILDPLAIACRQIEELRAKGVDAVVALTHQGYRADLALLGLGGDGKELAASAKPCKQTPDLVIGGHDHNNMALPSAAPRLFKADADAVSAWVVEIEKTRSGPLKVTGRLVQLGQRRAQDPFTQRITNYWMKQHDERFCLNECMGLSGENARACRRSIENGACLKEAYARTVSPIETEEIVNRSFETGFGNWLADHVRSAGAADVAFLNAGTIRINQNLPAGTELTRRHLEQMFPFKDKLVTRAVPGQALWRAMERAAAQRGEGAWAHFSGMAVQLAEAGSGRGIAKILVRRQSGEVVEIGPDSTAMFKVASSAFLLADGDGHGFRLCKDASERSKCIAAIEAEPQWPVTGDGADISSLVRMHLRGLGERGLELRTDRRLCDRGQKDCLISRW